MADNEEGDHFEAVETTRSRTITATSSNSSLSKLLFSDDDHDIVGLNDMGPTHSFGHHCSSIATNSKLPKMLCFGGYYDIQHHHHHQKREVFNDDNDNNVLLATPQKSGVTCSDSSSASSANNSRKNNDNVLVNVNAAASKTNRKRNVSGEETAQFCTNTMVKAPRTSKKTKTENPVSNSQPKARKAKLGERITALQQLVSPFGKTDTASVLHEAMGYIRFLQDQVQVLCSPYLTHHPDGEENGGEESRKDLKSRGLCLVPMECTVHVASSNGADYWSPAMVKTFSSSTKQRIHHASTDSETPNTF